jgi:hypothetical protein
VEALKLKKGVLRRAHIWYSISNYREGDKNEIVTQGSAKRSSARGVDKVE